jgi:hypothetical protein
MTVSGAPDVSFIRGLQDTRIKSETSGAGREAAGRARNGRRECEPIFSLWLAFTPPVSRAARLPRRGRHPFATVCAPAVDSRDLNPRNPRNPR